MVYACNLLVGFHRYNRKKSISENVDLPNSLLSRFDLLFLILDKVLYFSFSSLHVTVVICINILFIDTVFIDVLYVLCG